jgi:hypothetical protein
MQTQLLVEYKIGMFSISVLAASSSVPPVNILLMVVIDFDADASPLLIDRGQDGCIVNFCHGVIILDAD